MRHLQNLSGYHLQNIAEIKTKKQQAYTRPQFIPNTLFSNSQAHAENFGRIQFIQMRVNLLSKLNN